MSGRRPDSTRVYNFKTSFRESGIDASGKPGSEWVALPQAFKQAGYLTVGMGKLYHPGHPNNNDCSHPEAAGGCPSWTTSFNTTAPANVTLENHGAHSVLTCSSVAQWAWRGGGGGGGNGGCACMGSACRSANDTP